MGQDEVDIVRLADTSIVVNVPGLGDDVQASKAGIMEIADLFVINKADRDGVKRLRRELRTMIELGEGFVQPAIRQPGMLSEVGLFRKTAHAGVVAIAQMEQHPKLAVRHVIRRHGRKPVCRGMAHWSAPPKLRTWLRHSETGKSPAAAISRSSRARCNASPAEVEETPLESLLFHVFFANIAYIAY